MGQTVITHALEQTVICTHPLTLGRPNARLAESIMLERMRMSKRDFRRGWPTTNVSVATGRARSCRWSSPHVPRG